MQVGLTRTETAKTGLPKQFDDDNILSGSWTLVGSRDVAVDQEIGGAIGALHWGKIDWEEMEEEGYDVGAHT